ncbi:MAG: hypothetical protein ABFD92_21610 [Planctomycetaceae bacterium]
MTPSITLYKLGNARKLVFVKGTERYIFLFTPSEEDKLMRTMGRFAANPELSFTWYDAAVCSHHVKARVKR